MAAVLAWFWRLNEASLHEKAQAMAQKDRILLESILFFNAEDLQNKLEEFEAQWNTEHPNDEFSFDYRNQKVVVEDVGEGWPKTMNFNLIRQQLEHQIFQMFKVNGLDHRIAFGLNPINEKSQALGEEEGAMSLFVSAQGIVPEMNEFPVWQLRFKPKDATLVEQAEMALKPERERFLNTFLFSLILLVLLGFALIYALQSYRSKLTFLTSMNHDLLTPISVLKSASTNLRLNLVSAEKTQRYGELIEQSTLDLQQQIETAVDFARMELSRPDQVCLQSLNGDDLLIQVVESLQILYPEVLVSIQGELGEIHSDPQILRKVLKNLIDNAMKYQQGGEVFINLESQPNPKIEIRNKADQKQDLKKWMKPFFRETSQQKGMGLGLSIASFYAGLLKADLELQSQDGEVVTSLRLTK